jgi:hypothetical protein
VNYDSEQIFRELENLTQIKKIGFNLYNHDDLAYFEPFFHYRDFNTNVRQHLDVWTLLSVEARLKPVKAVIAIEAWKNLEAGGTYYLNSGSYPFNTRLYHEPVDEYGYRNRIRGYQSADQAATQSQKYQNILNFLETNSCGLSGIEISDIGNQFKSGYGFQRSHVCSTYYSMFILTAKLDSHTWICLCPSAPVETIISDTELFYIPYSSNSQEPYSSKTLEFQFQLDQLLEDLSPIQIYGCIDQEIVFEHRILYAVGRTEEEAVEQTFCKAGLLRTGEFKGFHSGYSREIPVTHFDSAWGSSIENCYKIYQDLYHFLTENLTNLTFYRYSLWIHEHIYIVGQTQSKDWLGIKLYSTYTDNP